MRGGKAGEGGVQLPSAAAGNLRHIGQEAAVLPRRQTQQSNEDLHASYGVVQRPVVAQRHSKVFGEVLKCIAPRTGQEHGCQIHGVVGGVSHSEAVGGEKPQVKLNVVPHYGVRPQELGKVSRDHRESRRPLHLSWLDAREALYVVWNSSAGIYKGLESLQNLVSPESHRSYFQNGVPVGVKAGGLQVQGNVDLIKGGNQLVQSVYAAASHLVEFITGRYWRSGVPPVSAPPLSASAPDALKGASAGPGASLARS